LGLKLGATELSQAPEFQTANSAPFAQIQQAKLRLKLKALWAKKIEMDTVLIQGLQLNLKRDAQGRYNWQSLADDHDSKVNDPIKPRFSWDFHGLVIEQSQLVWQDDGAKAANRLQLNDIELRVHELNFNQPIDYQLKLTTNTPRYQQWDIPFDQLALQGQLHITDGTHFKLQNTALTLHHRTQNIDIQVFLREGDLMGDHLRGQVQINSAELRPWLPANAVAALPHPADWPLKTHLAFAFEGQAGVWQSKAGVVQLGQEQLNWSKLLFDVEQQTLNVVQWQGTLFGLAMQGALQARHVLSAPQAQGSLALANFNLHTLLRQLKPFGLKSLATRDGKAFSQIHAHTDWQWQQPTLALSALTVQLDDSHLTGALQWQTTNNALAFQLNADTLNLDRYLPPDAPTQTSQPIKPAKKSEKSRLTLLQDLSINGILQAQNLTLAQLQMQRIQLAIHSEKGKISLSQDKLIDR
jgi:AsmA protein